jgi:hypothetical protein
VKVRVSFGQAPARYCLIAVCLVCVLISASAQALHLHSDGLANDLKHCPICQIAGAGGHAILSGFSLVVITSGVFHSVSHSISNHAPVSFFSLLCRPPPAQ